MSTKFLPSTFAIIPARGGSKRLPRKNIKSFCGFPLIFYSISMAKDCDFIDEVIVSTDDAEIASISKKCGARVFLRKKELAKNTVLMIDVLKDVYQRISKERIPPEFILLLQPTSPLRQLDDLKESYDKIIKSKKVTSVVGIGQKKLFSGRIEKDLFYPEFIEGTRSQEIKEIPFVTGNFYLLRCKETLLKNSIFGNHCHPFFLKRKEQWIDIDEGRDFSDAEAGLISHLKRYENLIKRGRDIFYLGSGKRKIKIAAITSSRSDFGIMKPVYVALDQDPNIQFSLIVTGSHFSKQSGKSFKEIENSGIPIKHKIELKFLGDKPDQLALGCGEILEKFSEFFGKNHFDLVLIMGDRYEYLPMVYAGTFQNQPFGHVHGGESTFGAIDDGVRHCLTKLSHYHFAANEIFASRIAQMGEEPWRIFITGSPSIDTIKHLKIIPKEEFLKKIGLFKKEFILVTLYPETIPHEGIKEKVDIFFDSLDFLDNTKKLQWLFTHPIGDTWSEYIVSKINNFCGSRFHAVVIPHLGREYYLSALSHAKLMLGNSSSGFIEAPSFGLPVINVGRRQEGRPFGKSIITVPYEKEKIISSVSEILEGKILKATSFYGDGEASGRIVEAIKKIPDREKLLNKVFQNLYQNNGD